MRNPQHPSLIKMAKTYVVSGEQTQGMGLRKLYHRILEERGLDGLAVNNPYTNEVELSIGHDQPDEVLQELVRRAREQKGRHVDYAESDQEEPLVAVRVGPDELERLRHLHYQAYLKSPMYDPSDADIVPPDRQRADIAERYRLADTPDGLVGHVSPRALRQLRGEELPYSWMLPAEGGLEKAASRQPDEQLELVRAGSCCGDGCEQCPYVPRHREGSVKLREGLTKEAVVRKQGNKWLLLTQDGSRVLGAHNTAKEAYAQEYAIQKSQERRQKIAAHYHGSPVADITELEPRPSRVIDGEKAVFASPDRDVAISFAAPWRDEDIQQGSIDGQYYMREQYPNAFEKIFGGKKGYVYSVDGGFETDPRLTRFEAIARDKRKVLSKEEIPDLLEALKTSKFRLLRYGEELEKSASAVIVSDDILDGSATDVRIDISDPTRPEDSGISVVGPNGPIGGKVVSLEEARMLVDRIKGKQDLKLLSYVPDETLESVRKHGLLSGDMLAKPENRALLELARGSEADAWLAEREEKLNTSPWKKSYAGPSLFFGPPDTSRFGPDHPLVRRKSSPVRINLTQLLRDLPETKLHGVEMAPYAETAGRYQDDEWKRLSQQEQDAIIDQRHRDITPDEVAELVRQAQNPTEFWKHFRPGSSMYAGDVPHVQVITPENAGIPSKYLEFEDVTKSASADQPAPRTGPEGILAALRSLDLEALEQEARSQIKSGKVTKQRDAIQMLRILDGLKRNNVTPDQFVISRVPVLPPVFRPYSQVGQTFVPGDANELYGDLFQMRDAYGQHVNTFGPEASGDQYLSLYDTVKALYGYGEPVNPKTKERVAGGFLQMVSGSGPKHSWLQRKLISKPVDSIARGVITVNPELGLDEIGIPEEAAWTTYKPYVQRQLVRQGMSPAKALKSITDRDQHASRALKDEMAARPVVYSRAPAWHKYNVVAGYPVLREGNMIEINSLVGSGLGADHNGDQQIGRVMVLLPKGHDQEEDENQQTCLTPPLCDLTVRRMIRKSVIPAFCSQTHALHLTDLQDFPHGPLARHKPDGRAGPIDFYHAIPGTMALSFCEQTRQPVWAPVAFYSVHPQREVEIVDLSNGRQITTDDDPRAVYGLDPRAGYGMLRCRPQEALERGLLVPCVRDVAGSCETLGSVDQVDLSDPDGRVLQTIQLDWDFGYLLGALAGDGWWDKQSYSGDRRCVYISDLLGQNARRAHEVLCSLFRTVSWDQTFFTNDRYVGRYGDTVRHTFAINNKPLARAFCEFLSLWMGGHGDDKSAGSANKTLPDFFMLAPREFREGLLCGVFDTDGTVAATNKEARNRPQLATAVTSTSIRLANDVKFLCLTLGVQSTIGFSKTTTRGNTSWLLTCSAVDMKRHNLLARLQTDHKRETFLKTEVTDQNTSVVFDRVPITKSLFDRVRQELPCRKVRSHERPHAAQDPDVRERLDDQNMYMQWVKSEDTLLISRTLARRIQTHLLTVEQRIHNLVEEACQDIDQNRDSLTYESVCLWRRALQAVAPLYRSAEVCKKARDWIASFENSQRRGNPFNRTDSRDRLIGWLREQLPYRTIAHDPEFQAWQERYVENEVIGWARVEKVQRPGVREDGYDLTVPGFETFTSSDGVVLSNTMNFYVPSLPESVKEAKDLLMPSKMVLSHKNPKKAVPVPKHESIWGLNESVSAPPPRTHQFGSEDEAMEAMRRGLVGPADEIELPDLEPV